MNKLFVLILGSLLCLPLAGCESSGDDFTERADSLSSYSKINHAFLQQTIASFQAEPDPALQLESGQVQCAAGVVVKILGKVAQAAANVKSNKDKANFENNVLSDLNDIKQELKDLDTKVTTGFTKVINETLKSEFLDTWNSMKSPYLTDINTAWRYYLNDAETGLLDKLSAMDSEESTPEEVQKEVSDFITTMGTYEKELKAALTNIDMNISNTVEFSNILCQYSEYLVTIDSADIDTMLSQYLFLYADLILYQLKATILLNEYYNCQLDSEDIVLNEDGYNTVMSDRAKDQKKEMITYLKNGLGVFMNNGERVVSQFNAGDIYRNYKYGSSPIRNSDYYPYIDAYIQLFYGYDNVFVFRLAWSEEAATNDPDARAAGKPVTGEFGYNYNYQALFDGLKAPGKKLDFIIYDSCRQIYIDPVPDKKNPDNFTTISTFTLYPNGNRDLQFPAGIRRYVFVNLPTEADLELTYDATTVELEKEYTFKFSSEIHGVNKSPVEVFSLYDPRWVQFSIDNLLANNNPLDSIGFTSITCASYTFGAYMNRSEYTYNLQNCDLYSPGLTNRSQASYMYGPFTTDEYSFGYYYSSPMDEIETHDDGISIQFTIVPDGDESTPIREGQQVVVYMSYYTSKEGYMYQWKSGKPIKFNKDKKKALRFNIKKKYIFPSGKLFSDDVIKKLQYFMLTQDTLCCNAMGHEKAYRLQFNKNDPCSMNNWFYLDLHNFWL